MSFILKVGDLIVYRLDCCAAAVEGIRGKYQTLIYMMR